MSENTVVLKNETLSSFMVKGQYFPKGRKKILTLDEFRELAQDSTLAKKLPQNISVDEVKAGDTIRLGG